MLTPNTKTHQHQMFQMPNKLFICNSALLLLAQYRQNVINFSLFFYLLFSLLSSSLTFSSLSFAFFSQPLSLSTKPIASPCHPNDLNAMLPTFFLRNTHTHTHTHTHTQGRGKEVLTQKHTRFGFLFLYLFFPYL